MLDIISLCILSPYVAGCRSDLNNLSHESADKNVDTKEGSSTK